VLLLLLRQSRKHGGRRLANHLVVPVLIILNGCTLFILLRERALPSLQTFESTWVGRSCGLRLYGLEHTRLLRGEILLRLLLLGLIRGELLLVYVGLVLLLLHCCRLLCILNTAAPSSELVSDLLWDLDRHWSWVHRGHVRSFRTVLRRQA
jgi:hypothetical protein